MRTALRYSTRVRAEQIIAGQYNKYQWHDIAFYIQNIN